jgi:SpoIID/LytB domain protein
MAVGLCAGSSRAQTAPADLPAAAASTVAVVSSPTVAASVVAAPNLRAAKARSLYFTGDVLASAEAFEAAVKTSSGDWRVWADGAIAWAEAGRPQKAVTWHRRAAALNERAQTRASVGWALLRAAEPESAAAEFSRALALNPDSGWALLGAGRAKLALGKTQEAVESLRLASRAAPGQSLADYYLGMAYERLGDESAASDAYRRAVGADSYFHEGRGTLARAYLRQRRYNEAWKQLNRLIEGDPGSKLARAMLEKIRPLLTRSAQPEPVGLDDVSAPLNATEPWGGKMPTMRVGVSSTAMGRPRPRLSATIHGNGPWKALDPKSGKVLLSAQADESWTLRLVPASKHKKKSRSRLELRARDGRVAAVPGDGITIKPADYASSALTLEDDPEHTPRAFRGELELTLFKNRRGIIIVNIIGLEDYTHGVVSSEMPERAPFEALKAQAIIARTHAYYIKSMTRKHKKEGYDLCDSQHCQVYDGLRAETERTRVVVADTRGRIATYKDKPALMIYSSHCGGRTQSGKDIGWGDIPYWKSIHDAAIAEPPAASPLELRLFLSDWPKGFDTPSSYVYPSHARWTRAVPAKDLEEKLNRKFKIGKLLGLRVLRRAASGHVESMLVLGSKRNRRLSDELEIRSLLAVGSLRSTLFVVDVEYRKADRVLIPETFVFRGGGWGHAVGLCQSGAMGRAEAGQDYETIVKAYFAGVTIGKLDY